MMASSSLPQISASSDLMPQEISLVDRFIEQQYETTKPASRSQQTQAYIMSYQTIEAICQRVKIPPLAMVSSLEAFDICVRMTPIQPDDDYLQAFYDDEESDLFNLQFQCTASPEIALPGKFVSSSLLYGLQADFCRKFIPRGFKIQLSPSGIVASVVL